MQVVGYDSGVNGLSYDPVDGVTGTVDPPSLVVADGGDLTRVELEPGRRLAYTLGDRHCAGVVDGDRHEPCEAPEAPYCPPHTRDWPCARCTGACDLPLAACREPHAVYLAAFAPATVKVGVTRVERLVTRLREQGADRGAHLQTVSNGRLARRVEHELATAVPDRVAMRDKVAGLGRPVDPAAWTAALEDRRVVEEFAFNYGLELESRPLAETLAAGRVVGTQGRLLVLERVGGTYAVDLRNLVGRELLPGATDRELQSTLSTFA